MAAPQETRSSRRLTFWRRQSYRIAALLGCGFIEIEWHLSRLSIVGLKRLQGMIDDHGAVVPVCWHQHLIYCSRFIASHPVRGFKAGLLISPSVDGEFPSILAGLYGVRVIRGSGTYTGPQAVRALRRVVTHERVSPLLTPDGPHGPRFDFKGGAIAVAQLSGVPIVPLAYAARSAKVLRSWDKFILPRPFTRVVLVVGEPYVPSAERGTLDDMRRDLAKRLHETYLAAAAAIDDR
jgi:lysophospholipid acyltransferase (LPLAT)-like uncharacterized protein